MNYTELVDVNLVTNLDIIPVANRCIVRQVDTTVGVNVGVVQVESVAVIGEVDGVRHRRVIELAGDFVLYLAVNVEGTARGFLAHHASRHGWGNVGNIAAFLQPGAAAIKVDADLGVCWAGAAVEFVGAALLLRTACRFFSLRLFFRNLLCVCTLSILASLACFLVLLRHEAREKELQCAVHCGLHIQRRIPVQYAKRMVGRRQYGGSSTYLPLKVNQAGVIPVIFASSLIYMPVLITQIVNSSSVHTPDNWWQRNVIAHLQAPSSWQYIVLYFLLTIFFAYFYVSVQYDPAEQADNMKKYGGFIPGIRPGRPTAEYLGFVMNRLLSVGALYLALIAILPNILLDLGVGHSSANGTSAFGGTAILIMVSVALTTVKQIESQLLQSNYEGLLK